MKKLAKLALRTIALDQLNKVTGGEAAASDPPPSRDPQSGLPTGKRM